ncbi:uncharacterized protein LOC116347139 [Contarinia nasturtii]|uniref:uncharacterized protein LOC116347139 n=1 Tax=Contarinia nasturtii TaxID=265458 RepID=UPI0012D496F2|nr:uncharacterized protein LOC116347139 [Contarinia nasturtii]
MYHRFQYLIFFLSILVVIKMILLLSITVISFLITFIHFITKPVVALLTSASAEEKQLIAEISKLKEELENISLRQEYTAYVKIERKIVAAQAKLNEERNLHQTKKLMYQYGIPYGFQALLSVILILITVFYRYTPIIVFNGSQHNFIPFGPILRFPTGIDGAVSVPFWIFVNNYVSRHVASYVK